LMLCVLKKYLISGAMCLRKFTSACEMMSVSESLHLYIFVNNVSSPYLHD
jgi:hypothetical protein